jgi:hypothetical protein
VCSPFTKPFITHHQLQFFISPLLFQAKHTRMAIVGDIKASRRTVIADVSPPMAYQSQYSLPDGVLRRHITFSGWFDLGSLLPFRHVGLVPSFIANLPRLISYLCREAQILKVAVSCSSQEASPSILFAVYCPFIVSSDLRIHSRLRTNPL